MLNNNNVETLIIKKANLILSECKNDDSFRNLYIVNHNNNLVLITNVKYNDGFHSIRINGIYYNLKDLRLFRALETKENENKKFREVEIE